MKNDKILLSIQIQMQNSAQSLQGIEDIDSMEQFSNLNFDDLIRISPVNIEYIWISQQHYYMIFININTGGKIKNKYVYISQKE